MSDIRTIAPEAIDLAVMRAVAAAAPHAHLDGIRARASQILGADLPRDCSPAGAVCVGGVLDRLTERGLVAPPHHYDGKTGEDLTTAGRQVLAGAI